SDLAFAAMSLFCFFAMIRPSKWKDPRPDGETLPARRGSRVVISVCSWDFATRRTRAVSFLNLRCYSLSIRSASLPAPSDNVRMIPIRWGTDPDQTPRASVPTADCYCINPHPAGFTGETVLPRCQGYF